MSVGQFGKWAALTIWRTLTAHWSWVALAAVLVPLQGLAVFWFWQPSGALLGLAGLKCAVIPLVIEGVIAVVTVKNLDQIHAQAAANPHSLLVSRPAHPETPPLPYGEDKVSDPKSAVAGMKRKPYG